MAFLDIGPKIENLEVCAQAEDIYLENNQIEHINSGFEGNQLVTNINLCSNMISEIMPDDLSFLPNLMVLNLSYNNLGENVPAESMQEYRQMLVTLLPPSLIMLHLEGNPCAVSHQKKASMELVMYRKPFIMGLPSLESLDKVDALQAEKLAHKGVLPKVARDLPGYLEDLIKKTGLREANEKLELQMAQEIKKQQGIDSH